jgi:Lon protease-like protein
VIRDLALFPLHAVLFPDGLLPLRIFEQRYMEMAKACLRDGASFGVCLIREGAEVGAAAIPQEVGCTARIAQWDMPQLGVLHIVARGERRFRILERSAQADALVRATVELLPEDADAAVPQDCAACVRLLERAIERQGSMFERPHRLDSCSWVSSRLAELLPLPLAAKQRLLELGDARARLEALQRLISARAGA